MYYGYWIVVGSFWTHVCTLGTIYSAGLYVVPIADTFKCGRGEAAWVPSIFNSLMLGFAYFSGVLLDSVPLVLVFTSGILLETLGLLALSYSTDLSHVYAASCLVGLGLAGAGPSARSPAR